MRHPNIGIAVPAIMATIVIGWAIAGITPSGDWRLWISVCAAALCVALAFATTRRMLFLSPQVALVAMYVMLIHVGAIGFYLSDPANNSRLLLLSSLALLACSAPLAYAWLRRGLAEPEGGVVNDLSGEREFAWNVFAALGVLGALYYLIRGASATGELPLLHLFHGFASVHTLAESRLGFATGTSGYLYEFYGVILPVSAVAFMLRWLSTRRRRDRRRALLLLGLATFTLVAAGYRGPIELFLVLIAIALSYALGGLRNRAGVTIGALAAAAFILLSLGIYSNPGTGTNAGQGMMARVFQVQAIGPAFVAQTFPSPYRYTDGSSLAHDLEGALPGRQAGFSTQLVALRGANSLNNPIGSAFDAYVNFGPAGIAALMFTLGWATVAVHRRLVLKRTASAIALGSGLSAALAYGALAGMAGVLLQYGVVTIGLMAAMQSLLRLRSERRRRRMGDPGWAITGEGCLDSQRTTGQGTPASPRQLATDSGPASGGVQGPG